MRLNQDRASHLYASRAWVLVLALLWAQSMGLWHGIVHGGYGAVSVRASLALAPDTSDAVTQAFGIEGAPVFNGFFESLFGNHHKGVDCQLYDQLCHGDALATAPVLVLPLGVPAAHIAHLTGLAVARWAALFQARGPPVSR